MGIYLPGIEKTLIASKVTLRVADTIRDQASFDADDTARFHRANRAVATNPEVEKFLREHPEERSFLLG